MLLFHGGLKSKFNLKVTHCSVLSTFSTLVLKYIQVVPELAKIKASYLYNLWAFEARATRAS